jgi:hypothetical protein
VSGQYTQTSGSALNSKAYCPDTRAFPYTETARLSAEEIFCLVSCPASIAKKYVPLLSDYLFVTRDFSSFFRIRPLRNPIESSDQTMSNFRQSTRKRGKQGTKGKDKPENKNGQQGGQVRGVGKSHAVDFTIIRSMLKKERGGTLKTLTL